MQIPAAVFTASGFGFPKHFFPLTS